MQKKHKQVTAYFLGVLSFRCIIYSTIENNHDNSTNNLKNIIMMNSQVFYILKLNLRR